MTTRRFFPTAFALPLRALVLAVMIAPAGLVAQSGPAAAVCGEDLQKPCSVRKVRVPCSTCSPSGTFCSSCFYNSDQCVRRDLTIGTDGLCRLPLSASVPVPQPVDF